jgi:response regulator of citrate/malate metabolism
MTSLGAANAAGGGAANAAKTKSRHHYQCIIGVSANSDADTIQDAFLAGVDAFMPKPFSMQTFNSTLAKLRNLHEHASIEE